MQLVNILRNQSPSRYLVGLEWALEASQPYQSPTNMEPLSIISLTGNIIQFIEFTAQLVSKGRKINDSKEGALIDHVDLSTTSNHLVELSKYVSNSLRSQGSSQELSPLDRRLQEVCGGCWVVASELIDMLDKLRLQGKRSRWRSLRQAFKSICGQQKVNNLKARLDQYRGILDTTLLVALRSVLDDHLAFRLRT